MRLNKFVIVGCIFIVLLLVFSILPILTRTGQFVDSNELYCQILIENAKCDNRDNCNGNWISADDLGLNFTYLDCTSTQVCCLPNASKLKTLLQKNETLIIPFQLQP